MELLKLNQAAKGCGGILKEVNGEKFLRGVSIDSRNINQDFLFFALKGTKCNGQIFAQDAIKNGAVCCVVDHTFNNYNNLPIIVVENTLEALKNLAEFYRSLFTVFVIGVTGSVGKTSTKDMIALVLSKKYKTLKTEGNYNSCIGLPLTVFNMESNVEAAVFEMGMSNFGELSNLSKISKPDSAVITNIGMSHIENLKTKENILKAKLEIFDNISPDGFAVLNGDNKKLWEIRENISIETVYYGISNSECDILASNVNLYSNHTEFTIKLDGLDYQVKINEPGLHFVYAALAAVSIGIRYDIATENIIQGVLEFVSGHMRQNIITTKDFVLIEDCYNANPDSMNAAINVLVQLSQPNNQNIKRKRSVAVLGDMLELGDFATLEHEKLGKKVFECEISFLILVGNYASIIAESAISYGFNKKNIKIFKSSSEAKKHIIDFLNKGDVVLFKGSRGMKIEEIINEVKKF
ncbi:MAG: UDP-N-acetylmuramoyl-tripeptide--D-alanyl-D-alanine ligase [Clostridiales bacterium]|jgi:UDP-N-acetylmuramoyl-tripeptide--D-alanyl-D-alanine ligase|nr:UDP-N-acetylmuramoyl-tripeptide--D-alanyl-D-alanine ligase [Clostridiales bacterium]